jgi:hypothetical protein
MAKILSGQVVLSVEGTPTQGPDVGHISSGVYITFPTINTGTYCYVGNNAYATSSDVATTDLYVLGDGGTLYFAEGRVRNLNEFWFIPSTNTSTDGGDVVCWITG